MQKMQNGQNLMDSNGGKTKMSSSGTSLAFQRAKEHPNRSSGVKVMSENVKCTRLILGGAGTRGWKVRAPGVVRGKQPGGAGARGLGCRHPGWSAGVGGEVRVPGV